MSREESPVYLDHNASTPLHPEVFAAMEPYLCRHYGNPSSAHVFGRTMHAAVERARQQVADLIGCRPEEIFFTSGGTESNNLAIRGLAGAQPARRRLLTSTTEHPATNGPLDYLEQVGYEIGRIGVDLTGCIDTGELRNQLSPDTLMLSLMHANSETGTLQPAARCAAEVRNCGALLHLDAAQTTGKIPVNVRQLGADLLSIAGHKLYAPQGVGALYVREGIKLEPLVIGAGHERGLRPGTENVASIVGLGAACALAGTDLDREQTRQAGLRDRMWRQLERAIPGLSLNGHPQERLPNTLNVCFPGVSANRLLEQCPEIAASTGSACHAGEDSASQVLLVMGIPEEQAIGAVRLSLGRGTTENDVNRAVAALTRAWKGSFQP